MFNTAKKNYWSHVKPITEWNDVVPALEQIYRVCTRGVFGAHAIDRAAAAE
jgi:hypothetical protein